MDAFSATMSQISSVMPAYFSPSDDALQFLAIFGGDVRPQNGPGRIAEEFPGLLRIVRQFQLLNFEPVLNLV